MGFCSAFVKVSAYFLVALVAVLAYFHLECQRDKETSTEQGSKFDPFNPKITDVVGVPLEFCKRGDATTLDIGLEYILMQSAPCALVKLVNFIGGQPSAFKPPEDPGKRVNITIHDARKKPPGTFHETGFTLIELDEEPGEHPLVTFAEILDILTP